MWDTQMIMEKRRRGDKDFIAHSLDLFIDFMQVFRKVLILLMQKVSNITKVQFFEKKCAKKARCSEISRICPMTQLGQNLQIFVQQAF